MIAKYVEGSTAVSLIHRLKPGTYNRLVLLVNGISLLLLRSLREYPSGEVCIVILGERSTSIFGTMLCANWSWEIWIRSDAIFVLDLDNAVTD